MPYVRALHEFLPRDGNHADGDLFSLCVFCTENIGGVAASRGGWRFFFIRQKDIRDIRPAWDFYFGHKDIKTYKWRAKHGS